MRAELSSLGSSTDSGEGRGAGTSSGTVVSLLPPFTGGRVETATNTTPPHAGGDTLANIEKNNPVPPPPAGGSTGASSSGSGSMPPPSGGVPRSRKKSEPPVWVRPFGTRPGATSTPRRSTPQQGGHDGGGSSDRPFDLALRAIPELSTAETPGVEAVVTFSDDITAFVPAVAHERFLVALQQIARHAGSDQILHTSYKEGRIRVVVADVRGFELLMGWAKKIKWTEPNGKVHSFKVHLPFAVDPPRPPPRLMYRFFLLGESSLNLLGLRRLCERMRSHRLNVGMPPTGQRGISSVSPSTEGAGLQGITVVVRVDPVSHAWIESRAPSRAIWFVGGINPLILIPVIPRGGEPGGGRSGATSGGGAAGGGAH